MNTDITLKLSENLIKNNIVFNMSIYFPLTIM